MIHMTLNGDNSEKVTYNYNNYPIYISKAHLSEYPDYTALAHWHNDIELIYILSGEMDYNINGEIVTIRSKNGIFVNSRRMHFGFSEVKKECSFICIRLHPILLCANGSYEKDFVLPLINHPKLDYILLNDKIDWQNNMLNLILEMKNAEKHKTAPLKIQSDFFRIWALLYEYIDIKNLRSFSNFDLSLLKEMLKYIQQNYYKKISLKEISKSGAIGQSKCCKLFSKYIGQSPNNYLINYRLQKSKSLLKNTDISITEIALETGFCDSSYFTKLFRKHYGVTPTEYRNDT